MVKLALRTANHIKPQLKEPAPNENESVSLVYKINLIPKYGQAGLGESQIVFPIQSGLPQLPGVYDGLGGLPHLDLQPSFGYDLLPFDLNLLAINSQSKN